jgi:hypothetical protein
MLQDSAAMMSDAYTTTKREIANILKPVFSKAAEEEYSSHVCQVLKKSVQQVSEELQAARKYPQKIAQIGANYKRFTESLKQEAQLVVVKLSS